jgi:hypothetical protein
MSGLDVEPDFFDGRDERADAMAKLHGVIV